MRANNGSELVPLQKFREHLFAEYHAGSSRRNQKTVDAVFGIRPQNVLKNGSVFGLFVSYNQLKSSRFRHETVLQGRDQPAGKLPTGRFFGDRRVVSCEERCLRAPQSTRRWRWRRWAGGRMLAWIRSKYWSSNRFWFPFPRTATWSFLRVKSTQFLDRQVQQTALSGLLSREFVFALHKETVILGDLPSLVVSPQQEDISREVHFEKKQETNDFDRVSAPVDVVSQKEELSFFHVFGVDYELVEELELFYHSHLL